VSDTAKQGSAAQVAEESGGWLDKPLVVDEKSLPSKDDMARFNVPVDPSVTAERRAKAAAKEARTRAAYGGAPSLDDTTPPWVHQEEDAPEEWSPRSRPWWKAGLLAAAVILISAAFVLSMTRLPFGDSPDPDVAANVDNSGLVEEINAGAVSTPERPPLMANPIRDGDMQFVVTAVSPDLQYVENSGMVKKPVGTYLVVDLQARNAGVGPLSFDPLAQEVVTSSGRRYGPELGAQALLSGTAPAAMDPGQETRATMAFDIPNGEVPVSLWLRERAGTYGTTLKFVG
jgi:hypothetical protein